MIVRGCNTGLHHMASLNTSDGGIDMTEATAHHIVRAARPHGKPQLTDFRLEETAVPTPSAGQVLLRVQYLSLDHYMRGRMDDRKSCAKPVPLGGVMDGESVATVIASHHPGFTGTELFVDGGFAQV